MAGAFVQSWSGSANDTAVAVTISPSPTANNLLVISVGSEGGSNAFEHPSGWTLIHESYLTTVINGAMYYRIADGAETTVTLADAGTTARDWQAVVGEYSGLDSVSPLEASNFRDQSVTATTILCNTATPSAATGMGIAFAALDDARHWNPLAIDDGYSIDYDSSPAASRVPQVALASKNYSAGALQHPSWSTTDTGDEAVVVIAVFKEASAGGPATSEPVAGKLTFKGQSPFSGAHKSKSPADGRLLFKSSAPTSINIRESAPASGRLWLKGGAPIAGAGVGVSAPVAGKLMFKGHAPTLSFIPVLTPSAGVLWFKGGAPTLSRHRLVFPASGRLQFNAGAPSEDHTRVVEWTAVASETGSWSSISAETGSWSAFATTSASWSTI